MDLFSDLFNDMWNSMGVFAPYQVKDERKCPCCNKTISQIRQSGRFGCAQCYRTFKNEAGSILRQIHSNSTHTGKVPQRAGSEIRLKRKAQQLRVQLQEAVKAENYEEAAKLHRQIQELEGGAKA